MLRVSYVRGRALCVNARPAAKMDVDSEVCSLKCRVFYHDHCFDGACSASVFTRFHRECIGTAQEFSFRSEDGCGFGGLQLEVPSVLSRSLFRWRVLCVGVYALSPRMHRNGARVFLPI